MIRLALEIAGIFLIISVMTIKVDGQSLTDYGATHGYKKAFERIWEGPPQQKLPAELTKELNHEIETVSQ